MCCAGYTRALTGRTNRLCKGRTPSLPSGTHQRSLEQPNSEKGDRQRSPWRGSVVPVFAYSLESMQIFEDDTKKAR